MEIHVRDESRIAEIRLTNAEQQDAGVQEKLKPLYRKYTDNSYQVAVFQLQAMPVSRWTRNWTGTARATPSSSGRVTRPCGGS